MILDVDFSHLQIQVNGRKSKTLTLEFPLSGLNGLSAYEVAVENGFVGTEQDWLNSLSGGGSNDWNTQINRPPLTTRQDFLNQNTIIVTHNMKKYPGVYVEDTGGNQWVPTTVDHLTVDQLRITFDTTMSGTIFLS